ncbi:MAG: iron-siderophore ABC transporter substrate-binding protein, partial [Nocardioidaceae bacterium]
ATAIALGVQPVGASDWLGFGGDGLGPWVKDGYTTKPTIIGTLEPSYEKIWDLHPDLILDVKSSGDQKRYDMLSKIAPTIGIPEGADDYMTGMTTQVKMIAAALGKPEKGAALLADIDQRFGDAAAAHPQFKGKTVSVSALSGGGWGAYIASTDRVRFLHRLGFENSPTINAAKPEGFTVPISAEKLSMLDADLVVSMPIGKPASAIADNPVFEQIPAVKAGRYLVLGNADVRAAYSTNTVLSIPYALDKMVPMLAAKLKS